MCPLTSLCPHLQQAATTTNCRRLPHYSTPKIQPPNGKLPWKPVYFLKSVEHAFSFQTLTLFQQTHGPPATCSPRRHHRLLHPGQKILHLETDWTCFVGRLKYKYPMAALPSCDIMLLTAQIWWSARWRPQEPSNMTAFSTTSTLRLKSRKKPPRGYCHWAVLWLLYAFVSLSEIKSTKDLSKLDRDIIVNGCRKLDAFQQTTAYPWLGASFPICLTPEQCIAYQSPIVDFMLRTDSRMQTTWCLADCVGGEVRATTAHLLCKAKSPSKADGMSGTALLGGILGCGKVWVELMDQSRYVSPFLSFISWKRVLKWITV